MKNSSLTRHLSRINTTTHYPTRLDDTIPTQESVSSYSRPRVISLLNNFRSESNKNENWFCDTAKCFFVFCSSIMSTPILERVPSYSQPKKKSKFHPTFEPYKYHHTLSDPTRRRYNTNPRKCSFLFETQSYKPPQQFPKWVEQKWKLILW